MRSSAHKGEAMEDTADTTRINYIVGADIPDKLTRLAGGERRRGEYMTKLIRSLYNAEEQAHAGADLETVKLTLNGVASEQLLIRGRLLKLEQTVAAMIAQGS
jgi:hypothetical protein